VSEAETTPVDHVERYTDEAGETRWRAKAANGEVIATSGEGYTDPTYCAERIAVLYPEVPVEVID